jgi:hypothetical protein
MSEFMENNQDSVLQIMRNMANNMLRMQHQIIQLNQELAEKNEEVTVNVNVIKENVIKENVRKYAVYGNNATKEQRAKNLLAGGMKFLK